MKNAALSPSRSHPLKVHSAACSDVGRVRTNNEDTFGINAGLGLYLVCDGMGGAAGGEVASLLACTTAMRSFASHAPAREVIESAADMEARLRTAFLAANTAVWRKGRGDEHYNMGTTMVAAAVAGDTLIIGNIGDSRAYLLGDQGWKQITSDHSYINELLSLGSISEDDIHAPELQRFGSIITRAIGASEESDPDFVQIELHDGDALLLASDGLTRYLDAPDFDNEVDLGNLDASCRHLIDLANEAGGIDNITCVLLRFSNQ